MNAIQNMKSWIGALTDLGLTLLGVGYRLRLAGRRREHSVLRQCRNQHHGLCQRPRQSRPGRVDRARLHPLAVLEPLGGVAANGTRCR